jgi:competence protein ComEA
MAEASPPNSGISAAPAPPAAPVPALPAPPAARDVALPAPWPQAAQRVTAGLLVVALCLLGWQALGASRWRARPTTLEDAAFRVDLNRADVAGLMQLPGIGESLARRIDEYRQTYGAFREVDDLRNVSGIGPATLERLRPFVYAQVGDPSDGEEQPPDAAPVDRPVQGRARKGPTANMLAKSVGSKKADALTGQLDINRATVEELQQLPGVGPAMSARIVAAREQKPFQSIEDLRRVRGIGVKTLERLRPHVMVGEKLP